MASQKQMQNELLNPKNYSMVSKEPRIVHAEGVQQNIKDAQKVELSCFDGAFVRLGCVMMGSFFFANELDEEKLIQSLSTNLKNYPIVSGRVCKQTASSKDKPEIIDENVQISCCNSGIQFYKQSSKLNGRECFKVENMVRRKFSSGDIPPYFKSIDLSLAIKGKEPLMKIVYVKFADGSCAISVSMSHILGDGMSLASFVIDWARTYSGVTATQMPVFSRDAIAKIKQSQSNEATPSQLVPELPTSGWWNAFKSLWNMWTVQKAEKKVIPDNRGKFSTEILHIPKADLDKLRQHINKYCEEGQYVGPNDVAAAFLWTLICDVRGRKLPGEAANEKETGTFMIALDMRQAGESIPQRFFGNASWALHMTCPMQNKAQKTSVGEYDNEDGGLSNTREVKAIIAAALKLRQSVNTSRTDGDIVSQIVAKAPKMQKAALSSRISMIAQLYSQVDGFMSSYHFPMSYLNFGGQSPQQWHAIIDPYTPYNATLVPALNKKEGIYLQITVPSTASDALQKSLVTNNALPGAKFL